MVLLRSLIDLVLRNPYPSFNPEEWPVAGPGRFASPPRCHLRIRREEAFPLGRRKGVNVTPRVLEGLTIILNQYERLRLAFAFSIDEMV